jgi:hypothetical protein
MSLLPSGPQPECDTTILVVLVRAEKLCVKNTIFGEGVDANHNII